MRTVSTKVVHHHKGTTDSPRTDGRRTCRHTTGETHLRSCDAMSLDDTGSPPQADQVSGLLQKAHRMAQPCR